MSIIIGDDPPGPLMTPERAELVLKFYKQMCLDKLRKARISNMATIDEIKAGAFTLSRIETMVVPVSVKLVRAERDPIDCKTTMEYAVLDNRSGNEVTRIAVVLGDDVMDSAFTEKEVAIEVERVLHDAVSDAIVKRLKA